MMCCITPLLQCSTLLHCCALLLHYCALLPLCTILLKLYEVFKVTAKANYDSKLQIVSNLSFETCNEYSTSLFRMNNLAHAFITVLSIQNIFIMEIFSSGTLSRIHAPHRIGWPVLTY